ncbi:MAG TPA: acetylornithine transaminase [Methylomirabilota bacterium]|jgi:acetylornithine aminotransferase/acetylornithine/N-succinyldiaminopimelate aminotransferase
MDTKTLFEWSATYHMPNFARTPICLVRGDGLRVWDTDGREYLDFGAGLAVTALGHCHPRVTGAIREASATLLHVSNLYHNVPQIHLAKLLCEHSFAQQAFFSNSGAEANEAAIKLARKYAKDKFATDRFEIIATHNSFHGRTLATLTATGQPKYHHGFEPLVPGFKHVPYNDLRAMERAIDNRTAAILVEPIQGEAGVNVPDDDYLPGLRKLCDESGALLILDEIQTGIARTGRLWCYQHSGIEPDIMTLAKALANGLPIGATLARKEVASALTPGTHGSTFGGNPFVTAVALACFTTILDEKIAERAARTGRHLMTGLRAIAAKRPQLIREVRGRGLLIGMELTQSATPVLDACREDGLLVLTAGEKVLRLAPPLIVEERDCDRALDVIEKAFDRARA